MDCPCETCLLRPVCGNTLIHKSPYSKHRYLIVEYAENCPYILDYFGIDSGALPFRHDYDKIYKLCRLFGAHNENYFVWRAAFLGIYN